MNTSTDLVYIEIESYSNDTRDPFLFPQQSEVPLQSGYTPAVKVLSRKPTTQGPNTISGLAQLGLDDGEEDDEEVKRQKPLTAEERQYKAQKDREEKQRKYDETRRRLGLGTTNESPSPGNVSPRSNQGSRHQSKTRNGDVRPSSAVGTKPRQLYDPNYQAKPDSISAQKQSSQEGIQRHVPAEEQPIRSPRGPDPTGKGFAPRAT